MQHEFAQLEYNRKVKGNERERETHLALGAVQLFAEVGLLVLELLVVQFEAVLLGLERLARVHLGLIGTLALAHQLPALVDLRLQLCLLVLFKQISISIIIIWVHAEIVKLCNLL